MERYRSGHNEAVLKTVCPQGRVGSNPTLSVSHERVCKNNNFIKTVMDRHFGEIPKWLKGLPWKGSRSLVAARGFKSLFLRSLLKELLLKINKKLLTIQERYDTISELLLRQRDKQ